LARAWPVVAPAVTASAERCNSTSLSGSRTWFLDACGQPAHPRRRLLLGNYDLGVELPSGTLQLGLNFADRLPECFAGREMGEDALRVLTEHL